MWLQVVVSSRAEVGSLRDDHGIPNRDRSKTVDLHLPADDHIISHPELPGIEDVSTGINPHIVPDLSSHSSQEKIAPAVADPRRVYKEGFEQSPDHPGHEHSFRIVLIFQVGSRIDGGGAGRGFHGCWVDSLRVVCRI